MQIKNIYTSINMLDVNPLILISFRLMKNKINELNLNVFFDYKSGLLLKTVRELKLTKHAKV